MSIKNLAVTLAAAVGFAGTGCHLQHLTGDPYNMSPNVVLKSSVFKPGHPALSELLGLGYPVKEAECKVIMTTGITMHIVEAVVLPDQKNPNQTAIMSVVTSHNALTTGVANVAFLDNQGHREPAESVEAEKAAKAFWVNNKCGPLTAYTAGVYGM